MENPLNNKKLVSIGKTADILGISIDTLRRWDKKGKLKAVRVGEREVRYYRQSDIDFLLQKPLAIARQWVSQKSASEPEDKYYCKTRDVFQAKLERLQTNLKTVLSEDKTALLTAVVGEIGNNSYDHNLGNWKDVVGAFFVYSLSERLIVLADRGLGILTTLKRVKPDLSSHEEALEVAFTQTISGRYPENRGNGLKFVRNVTIDGDFSLNFQTGDAMLNLDKENTQVKVELADAVVNGCIAVIHF